MVMARTSGSRRRPSILVPPRLPAGDCRCASRRRWSRGPGERFQSGDEVIEALRSAGAASAHRGPRRLSVAFRRRPSAAGVRVRRVEQLAAAPPEPPRRPVALRAGADPVGPRRSWPRSRGRGCCSRGGGDDEGSGERPVAALPSFSTAASTARSEARKRPGGWRSAARLLGPAPAGRRRGRTTAGSGSSGAWRARSRRRARPGASRPTTRRSTPGRPSPTSGRLHRREGGPTTTSWL